MYIIPGSDRKYTKITKNMELTTFQKNLFGLLCDIPISFYRLIGVSSEEDDDQLEELKLDGNPADIDVSCDLDFLLLNSDDLDELMFDYAFEGHEDLRNKFNEISQKITQDSFVWDKDPHYYEFVLDTLKSKKSDLADINCDFAIPHLEETIGIMKKREYRNLMDLKEDIMRYDTETELLPNIKKIKITNPRGINRDPRSASEFLHWDGAIECEMDVDRFCIRTLSEAIYRVKGSRRDFFYEMFTGITSGKVDENTVHLVCSFDHVS